MPTRLTAALPVLGALLATIRNLLSPEVIGRVPDDAFFYLVIARNLAQGLGFSFDGREVTTGFHPAWLALVRALPLGSPEAGFAGLLVLHGGMTALAASALYLLLRRAGAGALHAGLFSFAAGAWGASAYGLGMETALVSAALLGALLFPGLGLVAGLARPDALPVLLSAGRRAFGLGLIGVGAVLFFNRLVGGEWVSTSVALKGLGTLA